MESGQERKDRWTSSPVTGPGWFASLDGEILAANTEPLIGWHLRSCACTVFTCTVPAYTFRFSFPTIIKTSK